MTRAKAAALGGADELSVPAKALQTKRSAMNTQPQGAQRKRAALGDVSNVTKAEAAEGKKPAARSGLVSKAAHPTGVQKTTRTATRPALATKETKKSSTDVRRPTSKSGAIGVQKRKVPAASTSATEPARAESQEPSLKKAHTSEAEKKIRAEEKSDAFVSKLQAAPAEPESEPELKSPHASRVYAEPSAAPKNGYPAGVRDLDTEDLEDPLMVAEYANDIFEYLRDLEVKTIPNPNYMDHQDELEWKMRGILIDWLVEVHTRFHLLPETLFLAVNVVDRFLSEKVV
ncbi:hypothetical protein IMZ48_29895, partial [Candidatus Bathyarchaeota archaeon]|nr:hypothetical protein [Candidatus Bathyarchaeota archaeon]